MAAFCTNLIRWRRDDATSLDACRSRSPTCECAESGVSAAAGGEGCADRCDGDGGGELCGRVAVIPREGPIYYGLAAVDATRRDERRRGHAKTAAGGGLPHAPAEAGRAPLLGAGARVPLASVRAPLLAWYRSRESNQDGMPPSPSGAMARPQRQS